MAQHEVQFMFSAFDVEQLPAPTLPEIAFAGRSNVGKSSLLNALLGQRQLARVSSTPGRTRSVNFFFVEGRFLFADLPGYGFAKVPTDVRGAWRGLIDGYLTDRPSLAGVMLLVDSRHPPHETDLMLAAWLHEKEIPFLVLATKVDKVSSSKREAHLGALAEAFGVAGDDVLPVSSVTAEGMPELWRQIHQAVDGREAWLKAHDRWGVPSMKGPKAAAHKPRAHRKATAAEAPAEARPQRAAVPPRGRAGKEEEAPEVLTPLHPEFYKRKYKTPKKKPRRR